MEGSAISSGSTGEPRWTSQPPSESLMKPGADGGSRNISQGPPVGGSKEGLYPEPAPGHQGLQSFIGIFY